MAMDQVNVPALAPTTEAVAVAPAMTLCGASMVSEAVETPTAIVVAALAVQPALLVTVTEYVVFVVGLTVMDGVVAPVDQRYVEMPVPPAVSVTGSPGRHELVGPEMATSGAGSTVMVVGADVAEQPFEFVTVTL